MPRALGGGNGSGAPYRGLDVHLVGYIALAVVAVDFAQLCLELLPLLFFGCLGAPCLYLALPGAVHPGQPMRICSGEFLIRKPAFHIGDTVILYRRGDMVPKVHAALRRTGSWLPGEKGLP